MKVEGMYTWTLISWSFILTFKTTSSLVRIDGECLDSSIETRDQESSVVVSAKVLELFGNKLNPTYSANIQIKRVFKGELIVTNIPHLKFTHRSVTGNYNKVVKVIGLGNSSICTSDVVTRDAKIFFLDYIENARVLGIKSSVLPISIYNLKRVEAAANGEHTSYIYI